MAVPPRKRDSVRRAPSRRGLVAPLMLFVVATLSTLLWFRAVPATLTSLDGLADGHAVSATVVDCAPGVGLCTVRLTPHGPARTYDEPGLFAPSPGSTVSVLEKDGRVVQAGWPALAEAVLLVFLALCLTGFSLSWWRRVLERAPMMPDDFDDLET